MRVLRDRSNFPSHLQRKDQRAKYASPKRARPVHGPRASARKKQQDNSTRSLWPRSQRQPREGHWVWYERIAFLRGLRTHGKGKWKEICDMVPSRTKTQVKTHGQTLMKRLDKGEHIFQELDDFDAGTRAYGSNWKEERFTHFVYTDTKYYHGLREASVDALFQLAHSNRYSTGANV